MTAIVADLGNSRVKWGRVDLSGRLAEVVALPADDPVRWAATWRAWGLDARIPWRVSTVHPATADRLEAFLRAREVASVQWFRSAADVRVRHELESSVTAGADRALAVAAAVARQGTPDRPGVVVSCGTAVTVERVGPGGIWQGGAIAPGLGPMARALHLLTAQLPEVAVDLASPPAAWGRSTRPALVSGLFGAVVGTVRELVARQTAELADPWLIWTGGDAGAIADAVDWPGSVVVPHLVLEGLIGQPGSG